MGEFYIDDMCHCKEIYEPEHIYEFTGPCSITGELVRIRVPAQGLFRLRQGENIQVALPTLSADDREFILTGMSANGWEQIFGKGKDDD